MTQRHRRRPLEKRRRKRGEGSDKEKEGEGFEVTVNMKDACRSKIVRHLKRGGVKALMGEGHDNSTSQSKNTRKVQAR